MVVANIFVVVEVTFIPSSLFVFFAIKVLIKKKHFPIKLACWLSPNYIHRSYFFSMLNI